MGGYPSRPGHATWIEDYMASKHLTPTADDLRAALHYAPETGVLTWLARPAWKWNKRLAGKRAGYANTKGIGRNRPYRLIWFAGTTRKEHRIVWLYMTGVWPSQDIDHINGDGLDNRWSNLRLATRSENAANSGLYSSNTVGFKGVSRHRGGYQAHIGIDGRVKALGVFKTPDEAHDAYMKEARRVFGEFARAK